MITTLTNSQLDIGTPASPHTHPSYLYIPPHTHSPSYQYIPRHKYTSLHINTPSILIHPFTTPVYTNTSTTIKHTQVCCALREARRRAREETNNDNIERLSDDVKMEKCQLNLFRHKIVGFRFRSHRGTGTQVLDAVPLVLQGPTTPPLPAESWDHPALCHLSPTASII